MIRVIATLAALVAIAAVDVPAGSVAPETQATPGQKPRVTRKTRPRPPKARVTRKAPPKAQSSPPVAPLESEIGPSESDVARLARVRARLQAVQREILKLRLQADSTLRELDSIDLDLRFAAHQLEEAELTFKETRRLLDATLRDVKATRDQLEITRPRVQRSLSALSKLGELSYARLLFSLDDPSDILRGYRYVSRIATADGEQIKAFQASLTRLSGLEEQLTERTARNIETRAQLTQARSALSARKESKERRFLEITREQKQQEELAREYQKREAELRQILSETGQLPPGPKPLKAPPNLTPFQPDVLLHALKGQLPWPVRGAVVRKFGVERDPRFGTRTIQQGMEIDAFPENLVRAVHAGRVVFADQFVGYGLLVIVDHGHREHTLYGRLGELRVAVGDDVASGALVGRLPDTRVTGSGLHFEVRIEGKPEDPLEWLRKP